MMDDWVHPFFVLPIIMTCYSVLWLPKIMHGEILPVGNHYIHDNVDISDYDSPLKVRVQLMDNRDVDVCIYDQINNTPLHFITLKSSLLV